MRPSIQRHNLQYLALIVVGGGTLPHEAAVVIGPSTGGRGSSKKISWVYSSPFRGLGPLARGSITASRSISRRISFDLGHHLPSGTLGRFSRACGDPVAPVGGSGDDGPEEYDRILLDGHVVVLDAGEDPASWVSLVVVGREDRLSSDPVVDVLGD